MEKQLYPSSSAMARHFASQAAPNATGFDFLTD